MLTKYNYEQSLTDDVFHTAESLAHGGYLDVLLTCGKAGMYVCSSTANDTIQMHSVSLCEFRNTSKTLCHLAVS